MHYKNGRPVEIGDFVVGVSHNSGQRVIVAVVKGMMPKQGPCNILLHEIVLTSSKIAREREHAFLDLHAGHPLDMAISVQPFEDYGDAQEFIKVEDGLRLAKAAKYGAWDCPYFL